MASTPTHCPTHAPGIRSTSTGAVTCGTRSFHHYGLFPSLLFHVSLWEPTAKFALRESLTSGNRWNAELGGGVTAIESECPLGA